MNNVPMRIQLKNFMQGIRKNCPEVPLTAFPVNYSDVGDSRSIARSSGFYRRSSTES